MIEGMILGMTLIVFFSRYLFLNPDCLFNQDQSCFAS